MTTTHKQRTDSIAEAKAYFLDLQPEAATDVDYDPNIEDSDGLVSYIFPIANTPPPSLMLDIQEVGAKLQALVGIVTASVLTTSGEDTKKLHDFDTWFEPFSYIGRAWFSQFASEERSEHRQIRGVEVATEFIEIILEAVVDEGAALDGFRKFLQSQGETMRLEVDSDGKDYKYASLGIAHEVFQLPDESWVYVPKLRCFWTYFTTETFKINGRCTSYDEFAFNFDARELVGVFPYEEWKRSEDFRKDLNDFIDDLRKARIGESKNYFESVFASRTK